MKIVLLPGMDGTGLLFKPLLSTFDNDCELTVVDYPKTKFLGYKELIEYTISKLPDNEPYFLLGESFSGPIAISIAKSQPDKVKGLILSCTFVKNPRPFLSNFFFLFKLIPVSAIPKSIIRFLLFGRYSSPRLLTELINVLTQVSAQVLQNRLLAISAIDVSADLASLTVPILYLKATNDRVLNYDAVNYIVDINPGVRVVDLSGPHLLLQANPADSFKAIEDFMQGVQHAL